MNINKSRSRLIFLCLISLFLNSCSKCEEKTVDCPAIAKKYHSFFNGKKLNDHIIYTNDEGDKVLFTVKSSEIAASVTLDCGGPNGLGGCNCPQCMEHSHATVKASTESELFAYDTTVYSFSGFYQDYQFSIKNRHGGPNTNVFYVEFLDSQFNLPLNKASLDENESFMEQITFGGVVYRDVYRHENAITVNSPPYLLSSIYMNAEKGVIAFFDKSKNSLFYLEE